MKKLLALMLVLLMVIPFAVACAGGTTTTPAPATTAPDTTPTTEPTLAPGQFKGEVIIAASCALTGPVPLEGASARDGAQLAVDLCNAAGGVQGYKVVLQVEDDANSNDSCVNVTSRLSADTKILCQIGPIRSAGVAAIEKIIAQNKFPTLVGGTSVKIYDQGGGYIFRYRASDEIVSQAAIDFVCRDKGFKNIGLLYNNDDYGNGAKSVMSAYIAQKYPDVKFEVLQGHNTGDKDMTAALLAVKNGGCDAFIAWTHAPEAAVMTRQYRELGMDSIFFLGGPGWGQPGFHALVEDSVVNGVSTITDFAANNDEKATQRLHRGVQGQVR